MICPQILVSLHKTKKRISGYILLKRLIYKILVVSCQLLNGKGTACHAYGVASSFLLAVTSLRGRGTRRKQSQSVIIYMT